MTPRDSQDHDPGQGRQNQQPGPVTRDTEPGRCDKHLPPDDRDDRPTRQANESRYAAAPASDVQRPVDANGVHGVTRPESRIEVDDGHVIASVEPVLTDAAADVLWRIIDKQSRKEVTK